MHEPSCSARVAHWRELRDELNHTRTQAACDVLDARAAGQDLLAHTDI